MNPETEAHGNQVRTLRRKIRLTFLLVFAVWFGICFGISALLCFPSGFDADMASCTFAGVYFIGFLVLLIVLAATRKHLSQQAENCPGLIPPGVPAEILQGWEKSDEIYLDRMNKLERERKNIFALGILFLPFLIPVFILSEVNYRNRINALRLHPGSPVAALRRYASLKERSFGWIGFFILLFCLFMILFSSMLAFVGKSKVTSLNSSAKMVSNAAIAYQADLDYAGEDSRFQTVIINGQDPGANIGFHEGITRYFSDASRGWYAVICDAEGNVTGAMYAKYPITEEQLSHPQTFEEQLRCMSSLFQKKKVVGIYTVPVKQEE